MFAPGPLGPRGGSPSRRLSTSTNQILERLRTATQPTTLAALAKDTSLHPNTLREHLDTLIRAGFATRTRAQPHGRGRPQHGPTRRPQ